MKTNYELLLANYQLANKQMAALMTSAFEVLSDDQKERLHARYLKLMYPKDTK